MSSNVYSAAPACVGTLQTMHTAFEGRELGHYRITSLLGSGGMGEVYLARDLVLGRDVAIKVVTAATDRGDVLTRRLLQEAKAVAALDHPCICPVHDAGTDPDGRPYIVMQFVPGETLAARLERGPLPVRDVLLLGIRIADALALAHGAGIVHRDLKPQNVMITPSGEPRLLDFGIAKLLPASAGSNTETATSLTSAYSLVGTPAYMSPEQVHQRPVDGRSDLFSLGALLFEAFTGRRAFAGRNAPEVLAAILQVHPPAASTLRPELDDRHDELCRRLMAKDPGDRFQSAEEVVGALRVLLPDTSRTSIPRQPTPSWWGAVGTRVTGHHWWRSAAIGTAVVGALAVALVVGRPFLARSSNVPPEAARWFERGTTALREGAFHTAALALSEGLRQFGDPIAYAHLAEARAEMGDERGAQEALVQLSAVEGRLSGDSKLRVDAVRTLVLGDVDRAVHAYRKIAERQPRDAGIWLDLGRAQESAALLADARTSYRQAVTIDQQYAAGYLRLGIVASAEGRSEDALEAFDEAERLYHTAANVEGQAEVFLRRAQLHNAAGRFKEARAAIDRAVQLATPIDSTFHLVRARMLLSSVTASEGDYAGAEKMASAAVQSALDAGLDSVAAEGLIEIAGSLLTSRPSDAEILLQRSQTMAEKLGARRIAARAATQLAALQLSSSPEAALETLQPALEFFKDHHYRKYELQALTIAGRAYQRLDDIPKARQFTAEALKGAELTRDEQQIATALVNMAGVATVVGDLPQAVSHRARADEIYRKQQDVRSLAFNLTNRAELLILLGRTDDANVALAEIESGIRKKVGAFVDRARRLAYLRFLDAVVHHDYRTAVALVTALQIEPGGTDSASALGELMLAYAASRQDRRTELPTRASDAPPLTGALQREFIYWDAVARLAVGKADQALKAVPPAIDAAARLGNDELHWRLAAVGAAAARALGRADDERRLRADANASLARVRTGWGADAAAYEKRPDLTELKRLSGIQ